MSFKKQQCYTSLKRNEANSNCLTTVTTCQANINTLLNQVSFKRREFTCLQQRNKETFITFQSEKSDCNFYISIQSVTHHMATKLMRPFLLCCLN